MNIDDLTSQGDVWFQEKVKPIIDRELAKTPKNYVLKLLAKITDEGLQLDFTRKKKGA